MKSFEELEKVNKIKAEQLISVMEEHAKSGTPINGQVVIMIISRTPLDSKDRAKLIESARKGISKHKEMRELAGITEYQQVIDYLNKIENLLDRLTAMGGLIY